MAVSSIFLALILASFSLTRTQATTFNFKNNCQFTVWPGALTAGNSPPLGNTGFELDSGATNSVGAPAGWSGRFWGRTGCSSTSGFTCAVGDCGSGQVGCNGNGGAPPVTLAEFTLNGNGGSTDNYDISLVDGFNIPLSISPSGSGCAAPSCAANINQVCPDDLVAVRGADGSVESCKSGCLAKGTEEYCCTGSHNTAATCPPTDDSKIFKDQCPDAYTYAYDDKSALKTCPSGGDYAITFCP